jgi:primosomal protein N' (replication factor Y)
MTGKTKAMRIDAGDAIADVLVPVAVDTLYSYRIPQHVDVAPGDFVDVPLGTRLTLGVVWAIRRDGAGGNLKNIESRYDLEALQANLRQFIDWVARWTLSPRGMVLRMAIGAALYAGPEKPRVGVRLAGAPPQRMTPARARVIAAAEGGLAFLKSALAETAACSSGVIDSLIDEGTFETVVLPAEPVALPFDPLYAPPRLETAQFLNRFEARFGAKPAEWHSGVPARKRARIWSGVAKGEVKVVAGARSALFLPYNDLAAIIVDEEHEAAYKQDDGVTYHARDMAVVRGRIESAAVVLASATPAIETRVNAQQGRYKHLVLASRYAHRAMPEIAAVDLRAQAAPRGKWLSPRLAHAVEETLARGEQALLFLNRRGYAPLTLCRACGHRFECPNCTAWLVDHRFRKALVCHHCGHIERRPDQCPECEAIDSLTACGPGIERLAEEVAELFPEARALVLSSDFPGGTERLRRELEDIANGGCDIIIGTQLVAKGHHFPSLTLVGVVDADIGLSTGDPRAAERTFQLLQQVTGRAGRAELAGRALVQSWQPDHPVIRALLSGDAERFYAEETEQRRRGGLPPFGRLAALIVSGKDRASAETHARALAYAAHDLARKGEWPLAPIGGLPDEKDIVLLGPSEAPIAVIRGRHRFRFLVRAPKSVDLQGFLRALMKAAPPERGGIRVAVDVDPQNFM